MSNIIFLIISLLWAVVAVLALKGKPWCSYKYLYLKRAFWSFLGRCHKCKGKLAYTAKGRGICTNGDCQ